MRLIRLKVRNIASLKGEHEVDFVDIQRSSPLFAITGETGSGKSSILNSIGLALYGEIYKKNLNQIDVVTLGEKEGVIELIFQVKGKYYLADWRVRVLKQNGEPYSTPQSPVRTLYELQGDEFDSPKNATPLTCAELLNLDFDQFCRCIILNQGEFAKFLNSSFKDRRDILEKLYPGEMLDNLSRELETEKKTLEKQKHDLEIELHTLKGDNLSGDILKSQKAQFEAELKTLEETFSHLDKLNYHFVSLVSYHDKNTDNERKKEKIRQDMVSETTRYNALLKAGESILEKYTKAKTDQETQVPVLQTYVKKEETLNLLQEGWAKVKKDVEILQSSVETLNKKIEQKSVEERDTKARAQNLAALLTLPLEKLKTSREHFDGLFDSFNERELLQKEIKGKTETLSHLEVSGKELREAFEKTEASIKEIPGNIKDREKEIGLKKVTLQGQIDKKQRAEIKAQELQKQIEVSRQEILATNKKLEEVTTLIQVTETNLFPLETTLKLQEVLNASQVCVNHALAENKDHCPVCESEVSPSRWKSLKDQLSKTDLKSVRESYDALSKTLARSLSEKELYLKRSESEQTVLEGKTSELAALTIDVNMVLPQMSELDSELDQVRKQLARLESLEKERDTRKAELLKTRDQYAKLKAENTEREKLLSIIDQKLTDSINKLQGVMTNVDADQIRNLKLEIRNFDLYLKEENVLDKILQEKGFLSQQKDREQTQIKNMKADEEASLKKITSLRDELSKELKGEKASELIQKINTLARVALDEWNRQVDEQKKLELSLTNLRGNLGPLETLTKDFDLQYTKELHLVREYSSKILVDQIQRLKDFAFGLDTERTHFDPIKDVIQKEKETYKANTDECRMKFSAASARLSDWEKLQDKIQLLEFKAKDVNDALARKMRLFEVLGKDELRTFVLSLVEENLIHQTNEELQKLCQGRYEIVHQTRSLKMTPEFFILDKFREGGRRKVSTLSGGETFMVSLAMALGLAEMTRGQAEIDSLFIDEGFGTLDHESLEDVLDMLQQIQTRGLMVGVISHIRTLTESIPVNLVLNKKQDGTSSITVRLN